jgi:hypothetical protein
MNLFGLEGCGFILSLSLSLLLTGLTFYYFRMRCAVLEKVVQEQNKVLQQFIQASTVQHFVEPMSNMHAGINNNGADNVALQTVENIVNKQWSSNAAEDKQDVSDDSSDGSSDDSSDDDSDDDSASESNLDLHSPVTIESDSSIKTINLGIIESDDNVEPAHIITGACESLEIIDNIMPDIANLTVPALRDLAIKYTNISEKDAKKLLKPALKELLEKREQGPLDNPVC